MFQKFKEDTLQLKDIDGLLKGHVSGKVIKHELQPLTAFGENFGSEILRAEITVEENGQQKIFHAVAKLIPPTEFQLEMFNTQVTFKNETSFYEVIVPLLQNLQREYGISEIADYFPKLYGARYTLKPNEEKVDTDAVILLENLKIHGYGNIERSAGFDLDVTKQVLQIIANFHATAVSLKLKKPDEFLSKVRPYLTEFIPQMPPNVDGKDPLLVQLEPVLKENPNTAHLIPKLSKFLLKQQIKRVKKTREPWATVIHNDLWVNNIMLRHTNNQVDGIKLVDFQIIDYGSPISDLIFFLFSSVQVPVLRYHFEKLILYYYNEFIKTLQQFKVDLKQFSYPSFQEEVKLEAGNQIVHCLWMIEVVFGPKEMPKMPGKVAEWNPSRQLNNLANGNHSGPPGHGSLVANDGPPHGNANEPEGFDGEVIPMSLAGKEKVWVMIEEAVKRNWI